MSTAKQAVVTQTKVLNWKALYIHCFGHALNMAMNDCIRKVDVLSDACLMIKEDCSLVKKSSSRETKLKKICENT